MSCLIFLARIVYNSLFWYGTDSYKLWIEPPGHLLQKRLQTVAKVKKKAIRILGKIKPRESCQDVFREVGLLSLNPTSWRLSCPL